MDYHSVTIANRFHSRPHVKVYLKPREGRTVAPRFLAARRHSAGGAPTNRRQPPRRSLGWGLRWEETHPQLDHRRRGGPGVRVSRSRFRLPDRRVPQPGRDRPPDRPPLPHQGGLPHADLPARRQPRRRHPDRKPPRQDHQPPVTPSLADRGASRDHRPTRAQREGSEVRRIRASIQARARSASAADKPRTRAAEWMSSTTTGLER
jgi:hypothetical protein